MEKGQYQTIVLLLGETLFLRVVVNRKSWLVLALKQNTGLAADTKDITWVRNMLGESGEQINGSILLYDNMSVINIAFNLIRHGKTRHIEIDLHFIRQNV